MRALARMLACLTLVAVPLLGSAEPALLVGADRYFHADAPFDVVAPDVAAGRPRAFVELSPLEIFDRTIWWKSSSWRVPLFIVASVSLLFDSLAVPGAVTRDHRRVS